MELSIGSPVASSKRKVLCETCGSEVVKHVKVDNTTRDNPMGVFQLTTKPLTNENIMQFFKPKSSAPMTIEKRLS